MTGNKSNPAAARRGFLRAIGLSGAAAAAAVVPAGAEAQTAPKENKAEREKARYKADSAHVQAFYRTNRY